MFHGNDGIRFNDRHLVCALSPHVVDRGSRIDGNGDFGTVSDGLVVWVIRPYRRLVRKKIDGFCLAPSGRCFCGLVVLRVITRIDVPPSGGLVHEQPHGVIYRPFGFRHEAGPRVRADCRHNIQYGG